MYVLSKEVQLFFFTARIISYKKNWAKLDYIEEIKVILVASVSEYQKLQIRKLFYVFEGKLDQINYIIMYYG